MIAIDCAESCQVDLGVLVLGINVSTVPATNGPSMSAQHCLPGGSKVVAAMAVLPACHNGPGTPMAHIDSAATRAIKTRFIMDRLVVILIWGGLAVLAVYNGPGLLERMSHWHAGHWWLIGWAAVGCFVFGMLREGWRRLRSRADHAGNAGREGLKRISGPR